ncbi:MAG TPA: hypothetical protein VEN79_12685, partial [Terriglobia bacterium]|nr:hypothetical protein [Terriglobia bacterium]
MEKLATYILVIVSALVVVPRAVLTQRGAKIPLQMTTVPLVWAVARGPSVGSSQASNPQAARLAPITIDYPE